VRTGRFGLYVTDGEVNATLRLGDTPETISLIAPASYSPNGATPNVESSRKAVKKATKKPAKKATKKSPAKKATGTAKRAAVAQGEKSNAALIAATHTDE